MHWLILLGESQHAVDSLSLSDVPGASGKLLNFSSFSDAFVNEGRRQVQWHVPGVLTWADAGGLPNWRPARAML